MKKYIKPGICVKVVTPKICMLTTSDETQYIEVPNPNTEPSGDPFIEILE